MLTENLQLSEAQESLFPNITLPLNTNPSLLLFKSPPPIFSPELGYPLPYSIEDSIQAACLLADQYYKSPCPALRFRYALSYNTRAGETLMPFVIRR